jgi:hypothetical protein
MGVLGAHLDWVALMDRAGRPAQRLGLGVVMVLFSLGVGSAIVAAMWRSALTGVPMPDFTGVIATLLIPLATQVTDQITRSVEKVKRVA